MDPIQVQGWNIFSFICDILNITCCFGQIFNILCRNSENSLEDFLLLHIWCSFSEPSCSYLPSYLFLLVYDCLSPFSSAYLRAREQDFTLLFNQCFLLCYICHTVAIIQLRFQRIGQILSSFSLSLLLLFFSLLKRKGEKIHVLTSFCSCVSFLLSFHFVILLSKPYINFP